jgi:hypothetical protein
MMHTFNKSAALLLKHQNSRFALKNRSDEDLVELIKKALQTDINLDFLNRRELEILAACIRDRMGQAEDYIPRVIG